MESVGLKVIRKKMSKHELKQALISLVIGVLTMASLDLVNGFFNILQGWFIEGTAGTVAAGRYLIKTLT